MVTANGHVLGVGSEGDSCRIIEVDDGGQPTWQVLSIGLPLSTCCPLIGVGFATPRCTNLCTCDLALLLKTLHFRDVTARRQAAINLQHTGADPRFLIPQLIEALADDDTEVTSALATAICEQGDEAVPMLLTNGLPHKQGQIRELTAGILCGLGKEKEALPVIIGDLENPDKEIQRHATTTLQWLGKRAIDSVPALVKTATNEKNDNLIRGYAVYALAKIDGTAFTSNPNLLDLFADNDDYVAWAAVHCACKSSGDNTVITRALRRLLHDKKFAIRRGSIAHAIPDLGESAERLIPDLQNALTADDYPTPVDASRARIAVINTLGRLGPNAKLSAPTLMHILTDTATDRDIRVEAIRSLAKINPADKDYLQVLAALASDDGDREIKQAAESVRKQLQLNKDNEN